MLGICSWRHGFEAVFGSEQKGVKGGMPLSERSPAKPELILGRGEAAIITFEEAGDSEIGVIRIGEGRSEIVIELGAGGSFCLEDELSWFPAGGQIVVGYHGRMDEIWWRDNFLGKVRNCREGLPGGVEVLLGLRE